MALTAADGARVHRAGARDLAGRDERVPSVMGVLRTDPQWRRRPALVVARRLAAAIAAGQEERFWFEAELDWFLHPPS
ncbi:hypothetical protein ACI78T_14405 [Blastococcus sp. SYSU D00922]